MLESAPSVARSFSLVVRRTTMFLLATTGFGIAVMYAASNLMFGVSRHSQDMTVSTSECRPVGAECRTMADELLDRAIAVQQRAGLTCVAKAELTDVVLFQYSTDQHVSALTFDGALDASGKKLGWVKRYCR